MNKITLSLILIILASCSSINKMAINSSTTVLKTGGESLYEESDFEIFESSSFANIKTMEALYYFNPDNKLMNELLIKAYGAIAYGIYETRLLEAKLSGSGEIDKIKFNIKKIYSRAIFYAEEYIKKKGMKISTFYKIKNAKDLGVYFDDEDKVALFYLAQSLGGLLNADLSNMKMIERSASIKVIMDWVCKDNSDFEYGGCQIFDASYDALRPRMLGGNIERAKYKFQQLMEKYPQNLLIPLSYIEYTLIPMFNETEYRKVIDSLKIAIDNWKHSLLYKQTKANDEILIYRDFKHFNLFNAIAERRMNILLKFEKDIF